MRRLARVARSSSTKSEPVLARQSSIINNLGTSMRRKMSSASQVIAREEGRSAKVYTVSLLLLLITWSPFYILTMVLTLHLSTSLGPSSVVSSLATLYAPLSALLHGSRNKKVRRELCSMYGVHCEDLATPLPARKLGRTRSLKEARIRNRERVIRNSTSFLGELNGKRDIVKSAEGQNLLVSLSSSTDSSARSSFSSVSLTTGQVTGHGHPKIVSLNIPTHRSEALF